MRLGNGLFWKGDCLELMKKIPDNSIDMILCDLPYGTTQNSWDIIIPFIDLWYQYERICSKMVVLTSSQPFTSKLIMSNLEKFKYCWIWKKNNATGHLNAKKMPMKIHEDIIVFSLRNNLYNPQGLKEYNKVTKSGHSKNYGEYGNEYLQKFTNYPRTILEFDYDKNKLHPTQKPVALFEYLIKTYSNEGDIILDNCAGSGTTAIAAENTGRKWVCIEKDEIYYNKAVERIKTHLENNKL